MYRFGDCSECCSHATDRGPGFVAQAHHDRPQILFRIAEFTSKRHPRPQRIDRGPETEGLDLAGQDRRPPMPAQVTDRNKVASSTWAAANSQLSPPARTSGSRSAIAAFRSVTLPVSR